MDNRMNNGEVPLGLGMALARNMDAMSYFASLNPDGQREVIRRARDVHSKEEMRQFVDSLPGGLS